MSDSTPGDGTLDRSLVDRPADRLLDRPFVGRRAEWAALELALRTTGGGRGQLLLLSGEPGIGKTRLVDELSSRAEAGGLKVAWGRCWETGGAPAYFPFFHALGALWRSLGEATRGRVVGPATAPAAQLLRELGGPGASVLERHDDPTKARFELFEAVAEVFRRVSRETPVLLVLDDLHASDRSSLALLSYLARDLRSMAVLVVGTFRDVEARLSPEVSAELGRISREGKVLHVSRLDRVESAALAEQLGAGGTPSLVESLYRATQGNPFFIAEMLRGGPTATDLASNLADLPHGVRELIRQRLGWLSAETRGLLEIAATIGDEFGLPHLVELTGCDVRTIEVALVGAREAGIVVERAARRLGFGHALFREALYRDLPASRRAQLHGEIFTALLRSRERERDVPLASLAHHALEGGPAFLDQAVTYAARAADAALEVAAYEDALSLLERAHAAASEQTGALRPRAEALLALGLCRIRVGDGQAGKEACRQAADLGRDIDDSEFHARVALGYGTEILVGLVDPVLVRLLEKALDRLPPVDSPLRVNVLARLAGALQPCFDPERPIALARAAIAAARRLGDAPTLLGALHRGMSAMMDYVEPAGRAALNLEIDALAIQLGDRGKRLRANARLVFDLVELPDFAAAEARIDIYGGLADETHLPYHRWRTPLMRAMLAFAQGRFPEARAQVAEATTLAEEAHSPEAERLLAAHATISPFVTTDFRGAAEAFARFGRNWSDLPGGRDLLILQFAVQAAYGEDMDATRAHMARIPDQSIIWHGDPSIQSLLAEPISFIRERASAERILGKLRATGCLSTGMAAHGWRGPVTRFRALLLASLERWDEADASFASAHAEVVRCGARPHRARLEYEWARALLERGRSSDVPRARELLGTSIAEAETLGMPTLLICARRRQATLADDPAANATVKPRPELSAPPHPPPADSFSLRREGEYWTLEWSQGQPVRLKDSRGLQILAHLIEARGRDLHALDLAAQTPAGGGEGAADGGDAGEWLDEEARAAYRERMNDLRETMAEAESFGDPGRLAAARAELEALSAQLSRAVGLGGRTRRAGSAGERARVAVQRRVRDAIRRIEEAAPPLGQHLARAVYTGLLCSYRPDEPRRVR